MKKYLALIILLLVIATGLAATVTNKINVNTIMRNVTNSTNTNGSVYHVIYPKVVLADMWESYKVNFIQEDGRTIDKGAALITTSEGQSYTLLRAVWADDRQTFDQAWKWTNVNLKKRTNDKLFAWKWGQMSDGTWGVLEHEGGMNTASDADQDIALALILAYLRWNDDYYLTQARNTLADIWKVEVTELNGQPYLTAGNWATTDDYIAINPSYYSFAAYPLFAKYDPVHDWMGAKETSYTILNRATQVLPPDWANIYKNDLRVVSSLGYRSVRNVLKLPCKLRVHNPPGSHNASCPSTGYRPRHAGSVPRYIQVFNTRFHVFICFYFG